jgi:hypothetical protein
MPIQDSSHPRDPLPACPPGPVVLTPDLASLSGAGATPFLPPAPHQKSAPHPAIFTPARYNVAWQAIFLPGVIAPPLCYQSALPVRDE